MSAEPLPRSPSSSDLQPAVRAQSPRIQEQLLGRARTELARVGAATAPGALAAACRIIATALRDDHPFEQALDKAMAALADGGWHERSEAGARFAREMFQRLCVEAFDARRAQRDVERAGSMQRSWSPGEGRIRYRGLDVAGCIETAATCGGDMWETRSLPGGAVLLVVGDVTGQGIDAAMVVAAARGGLGVACRLLGPRALEPAELLRVMNSAVYEVGAGHLSMTCMAVVVHPDGTAVAAGASHPLPYIVRRDGELASLSARGPALGGPDVAYENVVEHIGPGESLLMYTDGLVECLAADDVEFGHRQVREFLRQSHRMPVEVARDSLYVALMNHRRGQSQRDDLAYLFARRSSRAATLPGG